MSTTDGKLFTSVDATANTAGLAAGYDPTTGTGLIESRSATGGVLLPLEASGEFVCPQTAVYSMPDMTWVTTSGGVTVVSGPAVLVPFTQYLSSPPYATASSSAIGTIVPDGSFQFLHAGFYAITANVRFLFATGATGGMRQVWFVITRNNGTTENVGVNRMAQGGYVGHLVITTFALRMFQAGDAIRLYVGQDSGVTVTMDKQSFCPNMGIVRIF